MTSEAMLAQATVLAQPEKQTGLETFQFRSARSMTCVMAR